MFTVSHTGRYTEKGKTDTKNGLMKPCVLYLLTPDVVY